MSAIKYMLEMGICPEHNKENFKELAESFSVLNIKTAIKKKAKIKEVPKEEPKIEIFEQTTLFGEPNDIIQELF